MILPYPQDSKSQARKPLLMMKQSKEFMSYTLWRMRLVGQTEHFAYVRMSYIQIYDEKGW